MRRRTATPYGKSLSTDDKTMDPLCLPVNLARAVLTLEGGARMFWAGRLERPPPWDERNLMSEKVLVPWLNRMQKISIIKRLLIHQLLSWSSWPLLWDL